MAAGSMRPVLVKKGVLAFSWEVQRSRDGGSMRVCKGFFQVLGVGRVTKCLGYKVQFAW